MSARDRKTGNRPPTAPLFDRKQAESIMFKGGLLWLIGIPLPIILLLFLFGVLR